MTATGQKRPLDLAVCGAVNRRPFGQCGAVSLLLLAIALGLVPCHVDCRDRHINCADEC